jgi:hypothetical protein
MSILETQEDINTMLSVMGEPLIFSSFSILGILDFLTSDLFSGSVEQQVWEVKVATLDTLINNISDSDEFSIVTNEQIFFFQLERPPIPYGDGWSRLAISLISTSSL